MCGIAGIVGTGAVNKDAMQAMLKVQHHRGPDATTTWQGAGILLGHNRLCIIDLSKNASQLPAGHYLTGKDNRIAITRWYHFEHEISKYRTDYSLDEVKQIYTDLLKDSIALRFRADVPVGFNISGGFDSSMLLSLVNRYEKSHSIHAYTFCTNDDRYDEVGWVDKMIAKTGNPHTAVALAADMVPEMAQKMAFEQDEPYGGIPTLAYALLFAEAQSDGIRVLLDGQGMDEQWAGYDYYSQQNDGIIQGVVGNPMRPDVLSPEFRAKAVSPAYSAPFNDDILNKQYRDIFYTKLPRALRFNDRISMALSTELREPFLDYRLVEFAFSLPASCKINHGVSKWMLREIARDYLPETLVFDFKRPLQTPQREWLAVDLQQWVRDLVDEITRSSVANWFDPDKMRKELDLYFNGNIQSSFHIWQYVSLGLLLRH